MARVTGAELLRLLRAEADRVSDIAARLREAVETVTDPTAAEAEVEAVLAAAEGMATQLAAAQARADQGRCRPGRPRTRSAAGPRRGRTRDRTGLPPPLIVLVQPQARQVGFGCGRDTC